MEKVGLNSVDLGYYYKRHGKAMVAKFRQDIDTEGYFLEINYQAFNIGSQ